MKTRSLYTVCSWIYIVAMSFFLSKILFGLYIYKEPVIKYNLEWNSCKEEHFNINISSKQLDLGNIHSDHETMWRSERQNKKDLCNAVSKLWRRLLAGIFSIATILLTSYGGQEWRHLRWRYTSKNQILDYNLVLNTAHYGVNLATVIIRVGFYFRRGNNQVIRKRRG